MKARGRLLRFRRVYAALPVLMLVLLAPGCARLPDVRPFTEATASLRSAVASGGAATVAELGRAEIPGTVAAVANIENSWTERGRLFNALATYAQSVQAVVDSGQRGAASAKAVADAVSRLATAANIIQPGAGEAGSVVTETAMLVNEWVAKARASSSLEKALAAVQPAVERVAQVIDADLKDLDALVRTACQAQSDALELENAVRLGYRNRLIEVRDALLDRMSAALADGKKASEFADADELQRLEELLVATEIWHGPLQAELKEIVTREKIARQLIAETQAALQGWASAHGQLLAAVRTRQLPNVAELSEAVKRIRELVQKARNL